MDLLDAPRLRTRRLELVAATPELARAAADGNATLARVLEADVPDAWPPAELRDHQAFFAGELSRDAGLVGWLTWFIVEAGAGVLVGSIGFLGRPVAGAVEIGYSMLDRWQRRGFASEAVGALIDWAFSQEVRIVRAHAPAENDASLRVLQKNGLRCVGKGDEPGTLRYELKRPQQR